MSLCQRRDRLWKWRCSDGSESSDLAILDFSEVWSCGFCRVVSVICRPYVARQCQVELFVDTKLPTHHRRTPTKDRLLNARSEHFSPIERSCVFFWQKVNIFFVSRTTVPCMHEKWLIFIVFSTYFCNLGHDRIGVRAQGHVRFFNFVARILASIENAGRKRWTRKPIAHRPSSLNPRLWLLWGVYVQHAGRTRRLFSRACGEPECWNVLIRINPLNTIVRVVRRGFFRSRRLWSSLHRLGWIGAISQVTLN